MTPIDLTLAQWQAFKEEFIRDTKSPCPCAFRIDGTQFSVARHYGGFEYNGQRYQVFYFADGALLGVSFDFVKWVAKKLRQKNDYAMKALSKQDVFKELI